MVTVEFHSVRTIVWPVQFINHRKAKIQIQCVGVVCAVCVMNISESASVWPMIEMKKIMVTVKFHYARTITYKFIFNSSFYIWTKIFRLKFLIPIFPLPIFKFWFEVFSNPKFLIQISKSKFPNSNFQIQISKFKFPNSTFEVKFPNSNLQIQISKFQLPNSDF